jgi:hypothetical protein
VHGGGVFGDLGALVAAKAELLVMAAIPRTTRMFFNMVASPLVVAGLGIG